MVFARCSSRTQSLSVSLPAALEVGDHALERLVGLVGAHAVVVGELIGVLAGAVEDRLLRFLAAGPPSGVERRTCSAWRGDSSVCT